MGRKGQREMQQALSLHEGPWSSYIQYYLPSIGETTGTTPPYIINQRVA